MWSASSNLVPDSGITGRLLGHTLEGSLTEEQLHTQKLQRTAATHSFPDLTAELLKPFRLKRHTLANRMGCPSPKCVLWNPRLPWEVNGSKVGSIPDSKKSQL